MKAALILAFIGLMVMVAGCLPESRASKAESRTDCPNCHVAPSRGTDTDDSFEPIVPTPSVTDEVNKQRRL